MFLVLIYLTTGSFYILTAAPGKSLQSCLTLCNPIDGSPTGSPVPEILQEDHWSGLPFPSPMHAKEKWKWSRSVVSDPQRPHGLQPSRLLRPWDFSRQEYWSGVPLPSPTFWLPLGFSNMWTVNFLMLKLVLQKGRGTRDQIANIHCIMEKDSSRKTSISALLTRPKPLTVWITIDCGKFWKRWEYQTTWSASWEICTQVRKQQLELDVEQQTGSK